MTKSLTETRIGEKKINSNEEFLNKNQIRRKDKLNLPTMSII